MMQAGSEQTTEVLRGRGARRLRFVPQLLLLLLAASIARAAGPTAPIITTYAGFGPSTTGEDPSGDGGPATQAYLHLPGDLDMDRSGNLYLVAAGKIRKVTPAGIISTVFALDNEHPEQTGFDISGIAVDGTGNVFVSDGQGNRVRKVSTSGAISITAGSGTFSGFGGDGGPATQATLFSPGALTIDRSGNLLIADRNNNRIRRVDTSGIITTLVGNGDLESSGDGGPAKSAGLSSVGASVMDAAGNLYLIDGDRIRKVNAAGTISAYAGGGPFQYDPVAANVKFFSPASLALDAFGNLYVAESHHLVRMISPQRIVRLVVGEYNASGLNGTPGYRGDGGPADQALLNFPASVAVDAQGNQYVSDSLNYRVRKITPQPPVIVPTGLDAFAAYELMPLAGWPADIVVGDVNGDRRKDVITSTSANPGQADPANDFKVRVHLQRADGTLAPPVTLGYGYPTRNTYFGGKLALADFNRDGILDVALGHDAGVSLIVGSRTSNFVLQPFYSGTAPPTVQAMTVGDMDRDGLVDVISVHNEVVDNTVSLSMVIAYGNGLGGTSRQSAVGAVDIADRVREIAVADINGDGWLDVIDANNWYVGVMLNDRHGQLVPPAQIVIHKYTSGLSVGDINGDMRTDVVSSLLYENDMAILPQGPQGLTVPPVQVRSYPLAGDVDVVDMDGDRRADVVMAHGTGAISLFRQTASGLQEGVKYRLPLNDVSASDGPMTTGDVNGDGCRDVVLSLHGIGLVTLKGQHCRISVNGSNPRVPHKPGAMAGPGAAVAQTDQPTVEAPTGIRRVEQVRDLLVRYNPLRRMLNWLAARYVAMSKEQVLAHADTMHGKQQTGIESRRLSRPMKMMVYGMPARHGVSALHGQRTVCAR